MLTRIIGSLCKSMVRVKADTVGVPSHDPSSSPFEFPLGLTSPCRACILLSEGSSWPGHEHSGCSPQAVTGGSRWINTPAHSPLGGDRGRGLLSRAPQSTPPGSCPTRIAPAPRIAPHRISPQSLAAMSLSFHYLPHFPQQCLVESLPK